MPRFTPLGGSNTTRVVRPEASEEKALARVVREDGSDGNVFGQVLGGSGDVSSLGLKGP